MPGNQDQTERDDTPGWRLRRQLDFTHQLDRLKTVERRTWLLDRSRRENSAEHSWHLALMAMVLVAPALWRHARDLLERALRAGHLDE